MSKQNLASRMAYDRSYVSHIENGKMRPTEGFVQLAEEILDTGGALTEQWLAILEERAQAPERKSPPATDRDLRIVDFVSWLTRRLDADFSATYEAVALAADRMDSEPSLARHARSHRHANVSRADLAATISDYYSDLPDGPSRLYQVVVDGIDLSLSVMVQPDWIGHAITLGTDEEQITFDHSDPQCPVIEERGRQAAITRLAEVEVAGTVMINNPIYCPTSVEIGPNKLKASFALSEFAEFALTSDLLESELVHAVASQESSDNIRDRAPLRANYIPTGAAAQAFQGRVAAGGPESLFAVARPARGDQPADYALLIQERSGLVLNAAGKLAVIPKAFHQPVAEAASEVQLSTTLHREFEEELLGRQDLEQLANTGGQVDPLHEGSRSAPLSWLLDRQALRTECVGLGINLVTGTYELACLMVVENDEWWDRWGHLIEANWESMRVHTYSSRDADGIAALIQDPRWSNEGLFAFIEGLRRLADLDRSGRVALPSIEVLEPK